MRKPVVLSALLSVILGLAACAPLSISAPFTSDALDTSDTSQRLAQRSEPIPATYYPTMTPIPTWTPLPRPTAPPLPTTAPTAPTPEPALPPPTAPPAAPPLATESPVPTAAPIELVPLPTLAPTAIAPPPPSAPTPVPLVVAADAVVDVGAPRMAAALASAPGCPPASSASFDLVPIEGVAYKNNALTDENPDLRLSILGYAPASAPLGLVDYGGATDSDPPKLHGLFEPNRLPAFVGVYQRLEWWWNELIPPYGARGNVNTDWPASVVDLGTTPGEPIHIPERNAAIWSSGIVALVIYASENEITLSYTRSDGIAHGYVIHLLNLCVDPNLVALYRAQLREGRRLSGMLPGLRNNQPLGVALGSSITVAIRDRATFLDPRSRKDWW